MFRISRFHAVTKFLPRTVFDKAVSMHGADKYNKGFNRWSHLLTMVYAQLSGASSLRTLSAGFNAHASSHYHLGVHPVHRSTLADANAKTDPGVFAQLAQALMARLQRSVRQDAQELLYLLDSTSITLKGQGFDAWTFQTRTRNTQGLKLHVLYVAEQHVPCFGQFTPANVNDVAVARTLELQAGVRYVFDKGYCDYAWWQRIADSDAVFVTRFKRNAALTLCQRLPIAPEAQATILADEIVRFGYRHNRAGHTNPYQAPLRRVTVLRQGRTPLVLATNDLTSPAPAIAQHYKARWGIELFFKWIKQHLRIKAFFGRSENAVKIQILTALIAYLLVALYQRAHAANQSLWQCLATLRASLFQCPDIEAYRRAAYQRHRKQADNLNRQFLLFA